MKNILTLTDFSETAEIAVKAAFELAAEKNAKLFIFHNISEGELISYELDNTPDVAFTTDSSIQVETHISMWRKLSAMHNVEAKYIIGGGMIQDAVNDIIQRYDVDIIIMGSHGRGQKNETWGSTTIQIVKQVDLPTLVIKQPLSDVKFDHIVYASTFNVEDRKDFTHFLQLIQPTEDTQIHLLSIDTSNYFSQPTIVMKEAMKDFIDLAYPHQCEAHFYPDYSVDAGIRHFIEEQNPDLLVMSNKHDKPIRHALRGNHTIKSIKDYAIPILSIDFPDED